MLVLASASPRRRELLPRLGLSFEVVVPEVDEGALRGRPERVARRLAAAKARAASALRPGDVILAADTVVAHRGELLGKPRDPPEAEAMLKRLRGHTHRVITAVAVLTPAQTGARRGERRRPFVDHAITRVTMRHYSDAEIEASIASGDPFDKAGAYAIQDQRFAPVAAYQGCYCNVVGLPLWTVIRLLDRAGLNMSHVTPAGLLPQCRSCPLAEASAYS